MRLSKRLAGTGIAAIMMLSMATGAYAAGPTDDNTVNLKIQAGGTGGTGGYMLNVSNINPFDDIVLKPNMPDAFKTSFAGPTTVTDLSGTGDGWNLTVEASTFKTTGGAVLLGTALSLDGVNTVTGFGKNNEVITVPGTKAIDNGAVLVASAAVDTGMGEFALNYAADSLLLNLDPTKVKVGNYSSTLTWTLTNAPA